ncbi:hypothetical protein GCM10027425_03040 [Alteromonas gracilis]
MRVHVLSPAFHGYHQAIAAALEAAGHSVTTTAYDHQTGPAARVGHQVRHELPRRVGLDRHDALVARHTARALAGVRATDPEAVLIVKGDTLGEQLWDHVGARGVRTAVWLYDELRRTHYDLEDLASRGPIATYSACDHALFASSGIDSRHLPLAYDHRLIEIDPRTRNDEIVFVGARYPSRERALVALADSGLPVRAFGREWSGHPVDRLRTWDLRRPPVPGERDLDRAAAYVEMGAATATLNIHGDQDGFTMRTFEASGVGGVQLIDRSDVADLYEPGREVLVFESTDELVDLCRRLVDDPDWAEGVRTAGRKRTLAEHTFDHRIRVLEQMWA